MKRIYKIIDYAEKNDLYPDLPIIEGPVDTEVVIDGKPAVMFASNNYLGLATNPDMVNAALDATKKYGVGSDGSRLLSGNLLIHRKLEKAIAEYKGGEDAIIWPTGYSANIGTISAFVKPMKVGPGDFFQRKTCVISDELNHASIIDGAIMGRAKKIVYRHNDVDHLKEILKKYKRRRKLIVTDGVFSMDGDIAPLDKIVELAKIYDASVMVDEAHATGVIGPNGHGTPELFNLKPGKDIDIVMGTFSKALASTGGFVVGSAKLIKYLRVASRSYMFSTAMTPASSGALLEAISILNREPGLRKKLNDNSEKIRIGLHKLGFYTFGSCTQIIPILIGKDEDAILFSRELRNKGYFIPAVRWPAVAKNKARLRLTAMSTHTEKQIEGLLVACENIKNKIGLIPPAR